MPSTNTCAAAGVEVTRKPPVGLRLDDGAGAAVGRAATGATAAVRAGRAGTAFHRYMPPRMTTTATTTAAAARGSHRGMRSARTLSTARAAADGPVLTFGIGFGIAMGGGRGGGRGAAMGLGGGGA